ncbi:MAG: DUF4845 domain-containing protein [Acidobacteriia bacterium]|nr:DUF4845 domain-containing protein [Terriglobia bacterium]
MNVSPLPKPDRARSTAMQAMCERSRCASRCEQSARRQGEKGAGSLKAIVWTAILAAVVYVGFKVTPLLINEYEFQDGIQTIARMASVNRPTPDKIRQSVLQEAAKDELLIAPEDIHIEAAGGNIRISADYSAVVDLKVYQWTLNFHPTASNNALF